MTKEMKLVQDVIQDARCKLRTIIFEKIKSLGDKFPTMLFASESQGEKFIPRVGHQEIFSVERLPGMVVGSDDNAENPFILIPEGLFSFGVNWTYVDYEAAVHPNKNTREDVDDLIWIMYAQRIIERLTSVKK